jgi:hypothetical protein
LAVLFRLVGRARIAAAAATAAALGGGAHLPAPASTGDFAFPRVADAPVAQALADAAAAAAREAGAGELAVLCARDFMRVNVSPPGEVWGVLGPLQTGRKGGKTAAV